eukprot:scaffold113_cov339-Pavlova_lutheri.AAC.21
MERVLVLCFATGLETLMHVSLFLVILRRGPFQPWPSTAKLGSSRSTRRLCALRSGRRWVDRIGASSSQGSKGASFHALPRAFPSFSNLQLLRSFFPGRSLSSFRRHGTERLGGGHGVGLPALAFRGGRNPCGPCLSFPRAWSTLSFFRRQARWNPFVDGFVDSHVLHAGVDVFHVHDPGGTAGAAYPACPSLARLPVRLGGPGNLGDPSKTRCTFARSPARRCRSRCFGIPRGAVDRSTPSVGGPSRPAPRVSRRTRAVLGLGFLETGTDGPPYASMDAQSAPPRGTCRSFREIVRTRVRNPGFGRSPRRGMGGCVPIRREGGGRGWGGRTRGRGGRTPRWTRGHAPPPLGCPEGGFDRRTGSLSIGNP